MSKAFSELLALFKIILSGRNFMLNSIYLLKSFFVRVFPLVKVNEVIVVTATRYLKSSSAPTHSAVALFRHNTYWLTVGANDERCYNTCR